MLIVEILMLVAGVVLVSLGADWIVKGGGSISRRLGISSVIVGLTVVSYGTSFPEFLVCTISAGRGETDLALGNVVGSNICNVGLVLGTAALLRPIKVARKTLRRDMPPMLVVSVVLCLMVVDGVIVRVDGVVLAAASFAYTGWNVVAARKQYIRASSMPDFEEKAKKEAKVWVNVLYIVAGGLALWGGSEGVIRGAVGLSERFDLDMRFVALSVVALGTSLPELAATVAASIKGEEGISLGNVIGSNVFNILFVMGFTAIVRPVPVALDLSLGIDLGVMLFLAVLLVPIIRLRYRVGRPAGVLLLACYFGYVGYRAWEVIAAG